MRLREVEGSMTEGKEVGLNLAVKENEMSLGVLRNNWDNGDTETSVEARSSGRDKTGHKNK